MPIRINFCNIVLSNCFSLLKLLFVKLPGSLENSQHLQLGLSFQSVSALNIKILISYFFQLQFALKITAFLLRTFHNYRLARLKQGTAASALLCTSENKAGRDPALFCVCTHFTVNYMQTQLIASKYPIYCITFRHGNRKSVRFTKIVLITKQKYLYCTTEYRTGHNGYRGSRPDYLQNVWIRQNILDGKRFYG